MTCSDECSVEKAEAKEFAYFSGLTKGVRMELARVLHILEEAADTCNKEQLGGHHSNNACPCWYRRAARLIVEAD